jgi:hypothetical protein
MISFKRPNCFSACPSLLLKVERVLSLSTYEAPLVRCGDCPAGGRYPRLPTGAPNAVG